MSRRKKLNIVILVVVLFFVGAYAKHKFIDSKFVITGRLSKKTGEISGIAASAVNKDVFYVMNDSGDRSRFFAISPKGTILSTISYTWNNTGQHDCEDIATGPGPAKGKSYVYVANIGDNKSDRGFICVYRVQDSPKFVTQKTLRQRHQLFTLNIPTGQKMRKHLWLTR